MNLWIWSLFSLFAFNDSAFADGVPECRSTNSYIIGLNEKNQSSKEDLVRALLLIGDVNNSWSNRLMGTFEPMIVLFYQPHSDKPAQDRALWEDLIANLSKIPGVHVSCNDADPPIHR